MVRINKLERLGFVQNSVHKQQPIAIATTGIHSDVMVMLHSLIIKKATYGCEMIVSKQMFIGLQLFVISKLKTAFIQFWP